MAALTPRPSLAPDLLWFSSAAGVLHVGKGGDFKTAPGKGCSDI